MNTSGNKRLWTWLIRIAQIAIGTSIIVYLIKSGRLDLSQLADARRHSGWMAISALLMLASIFLSALRWKLLLKGLGIEEPYRKLMSVTFLGQFFNVFLLGSFSGDLVKGVVARQSAAGRKNLVGISVLFDRALGLYSMFLVAAAASMSSNFYAENVQIQAMVGLVYLVSIAGAVGLALITLFPRLNLLPVKLNGSSVFGAVALGLSMNVLLILSFYCLSQCFDTFVPVFLSVWAIAIPFVMLASALPISPAGIGVGQVALDYFLQLAGVNSSTLGVNVMTLAQVLTILVSVCGGIFALTTLPTSSISKILTTERQI